MTTTLTNVDNEEARQEAMSDVGVVEGAVVTTPTAIMEKESNGGVVKNTPDTTDEEEEDYESYDDDDESEDDEEDDEEEEEQQEDGPDDDDDFALLEFAKRRLAEQKAKEEQRQEEERKKQELIEQENESIGNDEEEEDDEDEEVDDDAAEETYSVENDQDSEEEEEEDDDESEESEEFSDMKSITSAATAPAMMHMMSPNAPMAVPPRPGGSPTMLRRTNSSGFGNFSGPVKRQPQQQDRRKQRNENAELWALLQLSKNRVEETKSLVAAVEQQQREEEEEAENEEDSSSDSEDEDEEDTEMNTNTGTTKIDENVLIQNQPSKQPAQQEQQQHVAKAKTTNQEKRASGRRVSFLGTEDEKKEEETKRNFEVENKELWELLQQSKRRLEDFAIQKAKKEEKQKMVAAGLSVEQAPAPKKSDNPYKDIEKLPDKAAGGEDLTQKELLIAMAVAEEAARSGKDAFATPSRDVLRRRSLASFAFLKDCAVSTTQQAKKLIRQKDPVQREQSRFTMLMHMVSTRWTQFKQRANEIDRTNRAMMSLKLME